MMIESKHGSILVTVLVIAAFIMVVATVSLRSSTLLYELALDRVTQTEQLYAAQALLFYGIAYSKRAAETENRDRQLYFDQWPEQDGIYEGKILIESRKHGSLIKATLCRQKEELCQMQAEIKQKKGGWKVVDWQSC